MGSAQTTNPCRRSCVLRTPSCVTRSCICGSDLHLYNGSLLDTRVGMTFGHEFIGVVQEQAKRMLLVSKIAPEFETQGLVYRRNESTTKGARTVAQQEYEQSQAIDAPPEEVYSLAQGRRQSPEVPSPSHRLLRGGSLGRGRPRTEDQNDPRVPRRGQGHVRRRGLPGRRRAGAQDGVGRGVRARLLGVAHGRQPRR